MALRTSANGFVRNWVQQGTIIGLRRLSGLALVQCVPNLGRIVAPASGIGLMKPFQNNAERQQTVFLLSAAAGLTPIALLYGFAPAESMAWIFGIDATGVNARHIFRAFMGLYLALVGFWIVGAVMPRFRTPALMSLFVFMVGLAFGRLVSLVVDGWPHPLLIVYLMLEITFGIIGWRMLRTIGMAAR